MTKIYLATEGEYSSFGIVAAFTDRADAEACPLADSVEEYELRDGPMDVRPWHVLTWTPSMPTFTRAMAEEDFRRLRGRQARDPLANAAYHRINPYESDGSREFTGEPPARTVTVKWFGVKDRPTRTSGPVNLRIEGWDLDGVRKAYSEQRARYLGDVAFRTELHGSLPTAPPA